MDIMTLAAAKAYTDKKVAEGGGSGGGGGLPVVEITTELTNDGDTANVLNETDCAALNAAVETGLPIVLSIMGGVLRGVCFRLIGEGDNGQPTYQYILYLGSTDLISVVGSDANWYLYLPDNF